MPAPAFDFRGALDVRRHLQLEENAVEDDRAAELNPRTGGATTATSTESSVSE
jgi:hypothetical protein